MNDDVGENRRGENSLPDELRDSMLLEYDKKDNSHRPTAEHNFWLSFFEYDENRKTEFLRRVDRSKFEKIDPSGTGNQEPKIQVGWIAWDFIDGSLAKRVSLFVQYIEALDRVCEVIKSTQEKFKDPILLPKKKYEKKQYFQELLRSVKYVITERDRKLNSIKNRDYGRFVDEKQQIERNNNAILERWRKIEEAISRKLSDLEYMYESREYAKGVF